MSEELEACRKRLFEEAGLLPGEEWRPIKMPDFESDIYYVSNMGRVISMPRYRQSPLGPKIWRGKVLSPSAQRSGHLRVNIHINGKKWLVHVHRLVMWTFVGPQPKGIVVRHLDGDPANNALDNLQYGSQWNNITDTFGPAGCMGTGIVIGASLEKRIKSAIQGDQDPQEVLRELYRLLETSKKKIADDREA